MKLALVRIVGALTLLWAGPTHAAALIATGTISEIIALQNGVRTAVPAGQIKVGDAFALNASFDLEHAVLTALFDADPTTNIYYLPSTIVNVAVGGWSAQFSPIFDFNSSLQIWNDRDVVGLTDAQSFHFFRYNPPAGEVPFAMGTGLLSYSVNQNNFDWSATARTNDLLSQIAPFPSFGVRTFTLGFLNTDTNLFVQVSGTVNRAELVGTAIPEPATWASMIVGFGFAAAALRRIDKRSRLAPTA